MLRALRPLATESAPRARAESLQRLGAALAVACLVGALGVRCACAPDVAFLAGAGWITDPRPVDARVQQYKQPRVPVARFVRRFEVPHVPAHAALRVEAARAHRVWLNGRLAWASDDPDPAWRRGRARDVAPLLAAGANELAIEVWNPRGPPLLRARLDGLAAPLESDVAWRVSVDGGAPVAAVVPDDTRLHPSSAASPRPARALRARAAEVAGVFLCAAVALFAGGAALARRRERLPWAALAAVHAGWLGLFAGKLVDLPLTTGFDASNHLVYVDLLRRTRAVPLPTDGWSTYHPPLYYALVAALQESVGAAGVRAREIASKLPSFAAGLALVWTTFGLARALLPRRPELVATAVLFAGVLPLSVYTAAYLSNEPLHAALFALATLLCVRALLRPRVRVADAAGVGAAVGLALLAKVTALVVAAAAPAFLLARAVQRDGVRPLRLGALGLAYAAPIAALSGWFYARNVRLYGTPLAGNWDLPELPWWSQPGFHTPAYYAGFGESLRRPVLAGFHSFADALYSSFWGDGWIAGRASAAFPTEIWSWDFMAIGYWLALPASVALLWGLARAWRLAFAHGEGSRRAAWSFLLALGGALGFAMIALTLELPYFGQAKAPYLLGLVPVLAIAFALGADASDRALAQRVGPGAAVALRAFWLGTAAVLWLGVAA
ncbi:MAG: hypothetical protein DCC71_16070 [Proteobacteria bacterium]|nr:MAG: hypothetical protein DCC71_16070 [Pseudomonadota bacterium]